MTIRDETRAACAVAGGIVLLGIVIAVPLLVVSGDPDECDVAAAMQGGTELRGDETAIPLEIPTEAKVELGFGSGRGSKDDSIPNEALIPIPSAVPREPIDLFVLPLEREDSSIDAVSASAEVVRRFYRVTACVDSATAPPGKYTSFIYFPETFDARPIEVTATLKASHSEAWGLLGVTAAGALGFLLAYFAAEAKTIRAIIASTMALVPALIAVYVGQVVNDASFGRGGQLGAYIAVCLAAFTAATGAAVAATSLTGGGSNQPQR